MSLAELSARRIRRGGGQIAWRSDMPNGMKSNDSYDAALQTAFRPGGSSSDEPAVTSVRVRLHGGAIAFVAGFPGLVGVVSLWSAMSDPGDGGGAWTLAAGTLSTATLLLILGLASFLALDEAGVTVRFFGFRSTRVRFDELVAATFGMAFPSISFSLALNDSRGRTARIHANWWRRELDIVPAVLRELLSRDVAMDRQTAALVALTLKVKAPTARIVHRALLNRDKTW